MARFVCNGNDDGDIGMVDEECDKDGGGGKHMRGERAWYQEPRFEKKESYNSEEAIYEKNKDFMLVDIPERITEHGLSSEITQSPGGSSNTSEGSKTSGSFEDYGRSDED
ncbi:hypothetical protein Tco_0580271 [Tanacetum coccineum]